MIPGRNAANDIDQRLAKTATPDSDGHKKCQQNKNAMAREPEGIQRYRQRGRAVSSGKI